MRALLALVLLLLASPAQAQRSYTLPRFDSHVVVRRDGAIDVTETITADFHGQYNGIYRTIPVIYRTPQGLNWSIRIALLSATDLEGHALRTETQRAGHMVKFKVWVPGAHDAERTVVLRYRADNALRFFDDHDELYWNVTGDEWDVALGMVTARIDLPAGATGLRATAFNGPYGATQRDAAVAIEGTSVSLSMPRPLEFREGVTAVAGWDTGLVQRPGAVSKASWFLRDNWPLLIPLAALVLMLAAWRRRGRDPRGQPVVVQYEPPEGLAPAEAGTLTDERVDMRDITATVIDLAVRGFLSIEETHEPRLFGLMTNDEFTFHRLRPESGWGELKPHEREVMDGIFESGASAVALSDLHNEFYTHLSPIKSGVMASLVERGYYRKRPDTVRTGWLVWAVLLGMLIAIFGGNLAPKFQMTPVPFVIGGILTALVIAIVGWQMPARTVPGARALERVLGFEEFLRRVDRDTYQGPRKTPEMFERFLPYAMAFGVEQQWAHAFRDIFTEPPRWYVGSNFTAFNTTSFSRSLQTMTTRTASTMSSSPRSSSGSGFSGGSSGGGGGGGGGGAF